MSAITEEEKTLYREIFNKLDTDKSGAISMEELMKLMKTDSKLTEEDIVKLLKEADINCDGVVSFEGRFSNRNKIH